MPALPFIQPYNVFSAGLSSRYPRLKRASPAESLPRVGLAHQFQFKPPHQFLGRLADMAHRKSLSSLASPDGFKTIGKRLDDGSESFDEKGKAYD